MRKIAQKVNTPAIAALVTTAALFSLFSIVSRLMSLGFEPFTQVYLRIAGGALIAAIVFAKDIRLSKIPHVPAKDWGVLILMGTIGYGVAVYFATLGSIQAKLL